MLLAMRAVWRAACVAALVAAAATCGEKKPPSPTLATLHGEVTDPIGDALPVPGVPIAPDLVRGVADVVAGNISFTIQFARGTFDRGNTRVTIELDTDLNLSTGINRAGLGIDYIVDMWAPTRQTTISMAVPSGLCTVSSPCYKPVGNLPLAFVTNGMAATVPLALLGNASGRLNFRVLTYVSPQPYPAVNSDVMPDITLPPGQVR